MSADARFLVFYSSAPNLGQPQSPPAQVNQVYLHDRATQQTLLVSHVAEKPAQPADGRSASPCISADGRFVAFSSDATDLVRGQTIVGSNAYLYDRVADTCVLVSHSAGSLTTASGGSAADLSADGRFVVLASRATDIVPGQVDTNETTDLFVYDRLSGTNTLVSHVPGATASTGNGASGSARLSADGAWLAFQSRATDLVSGVQDDNSGDDVFLFEAATGVVRLVSRQAGANQTGNGRSLLRGLSDDGARLLLTSKASNLVAGTDQNADWDVFLYERDPARLALVTSAWDAPSVAANGTTFEATLSADGGTVALVSGAGNLIPGFVDNNGVPYDVFLIRPDGGERRLLSHRWNDRAAGGNGLCENVAVNSDGSALVFQCESTDLVPGQMDDDPFTGDLFVQRALDKHVRLVTHVHGQPRRSAAPLFQAPVALSPDGTLAVFSTTAARLTPELDANADFDVFVQDLASGVSTLVSRHAPGHASQTAFANLPRRDAHFFDFFEPRQRGRVSADGRYVVFESDRPNLAAGQVDPRLSQDVFLHDRLTGTTRLVSHSAASPLLAANDESYGARVSADGSTVVFVTNATDLVAGVTDGNQNGDLYAYDVGTQQLSLLSHAAGDPSAAANSLSHNPSLSADGQRVAFASYATDLVPGMVDGNDSSDVLLHDLGKSTTRLLSRRWDTPATTGNARSLHPEISADGDVVAFSSFASDLIAGMIDGNEGEEDVFAYDVSTSVLTLESHAAGLPLRGGNGLSMMPALSADGRYLALLSGSTDLLPGQVWGAAFLRDRLTDTTWLANHVPGGPANVGTGDARHLDLSADGRFLAYDSNAADLVPGQTVGTAAFSNVFVFDRTTGQNVLASAAVGAPATTEGGELGKLSADGRYVVFRSRGSSLVAGQVDPGGLPDLFRFDRLTGSTLLVTHRFGAPTVASSLVRDADLDASGNLVVFEGAAADLVPEDYDGSWTVFATELAP